MAVGMNHKTWERSLTNHNGSLFLNVPAPLVKSYGLVKGARMNISKIENGFMALVKEKPESDNEEAVPARGSVRESNREQRLAGRPVYKGRFLDMDGIIVD